MKIFYGPKGTGKTKAIIDCANSALETAKGHVIFITDTKRYTHDINYKIRFIDVTDFDIKCAGGFRGFVKGIVAANGDNEYVYIDGIARIAGKPVSEMAAFFYMLDKVAKDDNLVITVSVSAAKEELPDFVSKYID